MDNVYSIKINDGKLPAKALMEIKRLTGLSLSDIREAAMNDLPVFECGCADDGGLLLIKQIYDGLSGLGVSAKIYWYDSEEPYQNLLNAIQMHREIDEQEYD